MRAIARAWNWRRQLETGAASTIQGIAMAEKISERYVSRMIRLVIYRQRCSNTWLSGGCRRRCHSMPSCTP